AGACERASPEAPLGHAPGCPTNRTKGGTTMKDSSLNRWLWLIGLVAVALLFVSFGPLSSGTPSENASGATVAHWYNTHVNSQWATVWLVGLALFLLLV